jgi:hypothetical protein
MDTMKAKTVNSIRRQVLIAGVGIGAIPTLGTWASQPESSQADHEKKLVLSGRLTGINGTAISGAVVELEHQSISTLTDADGRFMLISSLPVDHDVAVIVALRNGERAKKIAVESNSAHLASNGVQRSTVSLKI